MAGETEAWEALCPRSQVKGPRVRQTLGELLRNCDKHGHPISSKSSVKIKRDPRTEGTWPWRAVYL